MTSNLGVLKFNGTAVRTGTPWLALNSSLCWTLKDVNSIEASLTLSTTLLCRKSTPSVGARRQLCTSSAVPTPKSPNDPVISKLEVLVLPLRPAGVHERLHNRQQQASVDAIADREKYVRIV